MGRAMQHLKSSVGVRMVCRLPGALQTYFAQMRGPDDCTAMVRLVFSNVMPAQPLHAGALACAEPCAVPLDGRA